jgi:hypothetical protein
MNMLIAQIKRYYISAAARAAAKGGELAARAYYNQSGSERGGRYEGRVACQRAASSSEKQKAIFNKD